MWGIVPLYDIIRKENEMKRLFKKLAKEKAKKERVVMFKIIKNRRRKNEKRT